jgi:hypothetical protein
MIDGIINFLNTSRLFNGLIMIGLNIGGKYIGLEIPRNLDSQFNHNIFRKIFVFCLAFMATHCIKLSLIITLLFVISFKYLFNEDSSISILGKKEENINKDEDNNKK